jgi:hypothetical protein
MPSANSTFFITAIDSFHNQPNLSLLNASMNEAPNLIYHYTTFDTFRQILEQKAILPDKTEPDNPTEIPTVTFSADQDWERTRYRIGKLANGQLMVMDKELLNHNCGGLIRIGVNPEIAPMDWHEMKDKTGLSRQATKGIYDFAIFVGARTRDWYATFEPVPEEQWITVQKWTAEETWVDLDTSLETEVLDPSKVDFEEVSVEVIQS